MEIPPNDCSYEYSRLDSVDVEIVPGTVDATINITSPSKEVPIKVVPKGNLAFGKSIKSMTSSVSKVTVYGEQAAIDAIEQLEVEIDVKGLEEDKEYNVTVQSICKALKKGSLCKGFLWKYSK